jgi:hypothetical protein
VRALRTVSLRLRLAVLAGLLFGCAAIGLASWASTGGQTGAQCTHGESSIGPVAIIDGKIVGDTTAHTSGCIPTLQRQSP